MSGPSDPGLVCLDISGTIVEGSAGTALPGAIEAVRTLAQRLPVRFVANATSRPAAQLAAHLTSSVSPEPEGISGRASRIPRAAPRARPSRTRRRARGSHGRTPR